MTPEEFTFWVEAFLAAIAGGKAVPAAENVADDALVVWRSRQDNRFTPPKTSQKVKQGRNR